MTAPAFLSNVDLDQRTGWAVEATPPGRPQFSMTRPCQSDTHAAAVLAGLPAHYRPARITSPGSAPVTSIIQHGVRYTWPGSKPQVTPCDDLESALAFMDVLAGQGLTRMEYVTQPLHPWSVGPAGLPEMIRHLAESRADNDLDDDEVRIQLAQWLPDRTDTAVSLTRAWVDLIATVRAHDASDAAVSRARVDAAVLKVVGGTA